MSDLALPLTGAVAVVTGGSSGIGAAVCRRLAAAGAQVAVVGGSSPERAGAVADDIRRLGGGARAYATDVADPGAVQELVDQVAVEMGPVGIAVSAAGVWFETPVGQLGDPAVDEMIATNLRGVINVTAAVAPAMTARGAGQIVNLASVAGLVASPRYAVYAATKAAVIAFTKATALELAPRGVHVNAVAPGNTATAMNEHIRTDPAAADRRSWIARTTPSTRLFTPVEEIAEAVAVLVDGRIDGFHGTVLSVDEGRTAGTVGG